MQPFKPMTLPEQRHGYDGRGSRCCFLHHPNFIGEKVMADEFFIERREDGSYRVLKPGADRASAVASTQAEAISKAKGLNPNATIHIERVRKIGPGPDKWRT